VAGLIDLDDLRSDAVAGVRAIYEASFPDELTAPFDALRVDRMLVRVDDLGPAGFALLRDLRGDVTDTGWTFLRYYAVGRRGTGVGSLMWRDLTQLLAAEGRTRLLWDVEDPDEPGLSPDLVVEHRRRIAFYERLGGRVLPVRGYEPPHDDGHAPHLLLMDTALADVPEPSLRARLEGVFAHRYGCAADHPAVQRALRQPGLA